MIILFMLSVFTLFYVFVGYPLVAHFLSKFGDIEVQEIDDITYWPNVDAVVVVFNEQETIEEKLNNLYSLDYPKDKLNVYVVDDNSTDNTREIIKEKFPNVNLLNVEFGNGKSNGLNVAMACVKSELVLMLDARQQLEKQSIKALARWFENPKMGAVSGELFFKSADTNEFSKAVDGYWKYEKFIRKAEAKIGRVPGVTGAIYMLRSSAYKEIPEDTLLDDVLIPMNIAKQGLHIGFEDNAVAWDIPSSDMVNERRRKVRTLNGNFQLWSRHLHWVLPFGHKNWLQFLSHKILRVLAPWFALTALVSALLLAIKGSIFALIMFTGILGFISVPLIGLVFPKLIKHKLLQIINSFVILNWFSVLGLKQFLFSSTNGAWKK